ncbi:MAG: type II secretion system protein [Candidatus Colwellbacteria bacterium]|nr:type II secretion system protein [Candidatus Colwellbacteria bacterium]
MIRDKNAFTLIEAVIVIGILSVLLAILAPTLVGTFKESDIDSAVTTIISDIRIAQANSTSGKDEAQWGVCFQNSTDDRYFILSPPDDCPVSGDPTPSSIIKTEVFLKEGMAFTSPASGASTLISFSRIRGEITANTTITITLRGLTRTINIDKSGLIYCSDC